jgi:hypothetical protein
MTGATKFSNDDNNREGRDGKRQLRAWHFAPLMIGMAKGTVRQGRVHRVMAEGHNQFILGCTKAEPSLCPVWWRWHFCSSVHPQFAGLCCFIANRLNHCGMCPTSCNELRQSVLLAIGVCIVYKAGKCDIYLNTIVTL